MFYSCYTILFCHMVALSQIWLQSSQIVWVTKQIEEQEDEQERWRTSTKTSRPRIMREWEGLVKLLTEFSITSHLPKRDVIMSKTNERRLTRMLSTASLGSIWHEDSWRWCVWSWWGRCHKDILGLYLADVRCNQNIICVLITDTFCPAGLLGSSGRAPMQGTNGSIEWYSAGYH